MMTKEEEAISPETPRLIQLNTVADERGKLTAIEELRDIPFEIKRIFYVHDVISDRGGHSHIDTDQLLVALSGAFQVAIRTPHSQKQFTLSTASEGLYVPRLHFTEMTEFTNGSVCLVLASTHYDMKRSLRTWEDYIEYLEENA